VQFKILQEGGESGGVIPASEV